MFCGKNWRLNIMVGIKQVNISSAIFRFFSKFYFLVANPDLQTHLCFVTCDVWIKKLIYDWVRDFDDTNMISRISPCVIVHARCKRYFVWLSTRDANVILLLYFYDYLFSKCRVIRLEQFFLFCSLNALDWMRSFANVNTNWSF